MEAVDIGIVIDTTGSMIDDIDAARAEALALADSVIDDFTGGGVGPFSIVTLATTSSLDLRCHSLVTAAPSAAGLDSLVAYGGGDFPEAVLSGINTALRDLIGSTAL